LRSNIPPTINVFIRHDRRAEMHSCPGAAGRSCKHLKEQRLQCGSARTAIRCSILTTCGWMMWKTGSRRASHPGRSDPLRRLAIRPRRLGCVGTTPKPERNYVVGYRRQVHSICLPQGGRGAGQDAQTVSIKRINLERFGRIAPEASVSLPLIKSDVPLTSISGGTDINGVALTRRSPHRRCEGRNPGAPGSARMRWTFLVGGRKKPVSDAEGGSVSAPGRSSQCRSDVGNDPGATNYRAALFRAAF